MNQPLVSILILNWNGEEIIQECLNSILQLNYKNIETIVVDNGSHDDSLTILSQYNQIKVIASNTNLGYAGGNNLGFNHCNGKYIATLNNDIIVEPTWLDEIVPVLEENEKIGIIASRQMNYYSRNSIDSLFSIPTSHLLLGRFQHKNRYNPHNNFHSKKGYVLGANGASAVYRKILLQELGGFEESFFAYQEENDLHMRAFYNGWKCFYVPEAVVYHKGSYSFKKVPEIFHYYHERNRIWFIYRNFSLSIIFRFLPVIIFRELRTMIKLVVIKRKPVIYFKARYDGFTGMFQFKNQRKKSLIAAKEFSGTLLTLFKNKILSSQ